MPQAPKFSPEKKSQLRRDVLEELDKTVPAKPIKPTKIIAVKKSAPALPKSPVKPIKSEKKPVVKPIVTKNIPKIKSSASFSKLSALKPQINLELPEIKLLPKPKMDWKKYLLIGLPLLLVLALAADIFGIYRLGFADTFSQTIARVLVLPAGSVGRDKISAAAYLDDLKILKQAIDNGREGLGQLSDSQDLKDKVFLRLAAIDIINLKLAQYNKPLTSEAIKTGMAKIISQFGSEAEAQKAIKSLYGLDLKTFEEKVLRPLLARDALQELISQDENLKINQDAKAKAEEVLALAKDKSVNFSILAGQYTEDEAGIRTGGDLGWVNKGELSADLESVLFSLPENTVYGELIKNKFGYHILMVESKLKNPTDGKESVKARHILIRVDVDKYIKELLDSAKIKKYIK